MRVAFNPEKGIAEVRGDNPLDRWAFTLDCSVGSAHINLDDVNFAVRPLAWRQKRLLARFSSLGAEFVRLQFLQLASGGSRLPDRSVAQEALLTLALWINAPSETSLAALDSAFLARVETDVCRTLGLRPGDLDQREAVDVEEVWSSLSRTADIEIAPAPSQTSPSASPDPVRSTPLTGDVRRIRILPDPVPEKGGTRGQADQPIKAQPRPSPPAEPAAILDNPTSIEPADERLLAASPPLPAALPSGPQFVAQSTLRWTLQRSRPVRGSSAHHQQSPSPSLESAIPSGPQPDTSEVRERIAPANALQPDIALRRSAATSVEALPRLVHSAEMPKTEPIQIEAPAASPIPPIDVDALFDELSDRLEQAAANLGIEVGV
jgi:hypothetical protein